MNIELMKFVILCALICIIVVQHNMIIRDSAALEDYRDQIHTLSVQSHEQAEKVEVAESAANEAVRYIRANQNVIMRKTIPGGCDAAIRFGITQAKSFA